MEKRLGVRRLERLNPLKLKEVETLEIDIFNKSENAMGKMLFD